MKGSLRLRLLHGVISLILAGALCACATRAAPGLAVADALPPPDPAAALVVRPEYRIGPNDLLSIVVFQVKDLEREVRVDNAGQISLPLIGSIQAAGDTVAELEQAIAQRYRERFLQDPQVTVFLKDQASQRVTVEGAVTTPGIYPIATRLSLLQAIALSKGPNNVANEHNIVVFRTTRGQRFLARFDLERIREGSAPDPELQGEDVVVVDESAGKVWLRRFIELTPLIGVWRVVR